MQHQRQIKSAMSAFPDPQWLQHLQKRAIPAKVSHLYESAVQSIRMAAQNKERFIVLRLREPALIKRTVIGLLEHDGFSVLPCGMENSFFVSWKRLHITKPVGLAKRMFELAYSTAHTALQAEDVPRLLQEAARDGACYMKIKKSQLAEQIKEVIDAARAAGYAVHETDPGKTTSGSVFICWHESVESGESTTDKSA